MDDPKPAPSAPPGEARGTEPARCSYRWNLGTERCGKSAGHDGSHQTMHGVLAEADLAALRASLERERERAESLKRLAHEDAGTIATLSADRDALRSRILALAEELSRYSPLTSIGALQLPKRLRSIAKGES